MLLLIFPSLSPYIRTILSGVLSLAALYHILHFFASISLDITAAIEYTTLNKQNMPDKRGHAMFRLWGKEFKDNRMLRDTVICNDSDDTRTHKVFGALEDICYEFDLSKPIWLDSTVEEFKRHSKARFYQDNFVDSIDFDYLEIHVIEE